MDLKELGKTTIESRQPKGSDELVKFQRNAKPGLRRENREGAIGGRENRLIRVALPLLLTIYPPIELSRYIFAYGISPELLFELFFMWTAYLLFLALLLYSERMNILGLKFSRVKRMKDISRQELVDIQTALDFLHTELEKIAQVVSNNSTVLTRVDRKVYRDEAKEKELSGNGERKANPFQETKPAQPQPRIYQAGEDYFG